MRLLEIVQFRLPVVMSMPAAPPPTGKKSWIKLPSITLPVLIVLVFVVVPKPSIALDGSVVPAGPMSLLETVLKLLPKPVVVVWKRTIPEASPTPLVSEPSREQFFTVLFWAPLMKRIALVGIPPAPVNIFEIVGELAFELRPSIVTQSAPFRSISGAKMVPEMVRAPEGSIRIEPYEAEPVPLELRTAEAVSAVFPKIQIVIKF